MKLKCLVFILCISFAASLFPTAISAETEMFMRAKLLDVSGTEIEQDNLEQARSVVVDIEKGEPAMEAELIAAAYNAEGHLLDVLAKKISMPVGTSYHHTFDINPPANSAERLTVFLWDSRENCTPLAKRFSFYKTRFSAILEDNFYIQQAKGEEVDGEKHGVRSLPFLYSFGNTVFAAYSQHTDTYDVSPYDAVSISRDGGKTWGEKIVNQDFYLTSMIKKQTGELFAINYITYFKDNSNLKMYYWTSADDGKNWEKNEGNIVFDGNVQAGANSVWGSMVLHRSAIELRDGSLLATMYGRLSGDTQYRCILIKSMDGGESWTYYSDIASGAPVAPDGEKLTEVLGFCEPVVVRCADDSLLAVMRIGNGDQPLYQARSTDDGLTWSKPAVLPGIKDFTKVYSVDPELHLLSDGTLALSYGRPNSKMVFSMDGCGYQWAEETVQTVWSGGSGYTGFREISPGRALVIGDIGASHLLMNNYGIWGRFINISHRKSSEGTPTSLLLMTDKTYLKKGESTALTFKVFDQDGRLYNSSNHQITFKDKNQVTSIDENGIVTAVADGRAEITAEIQTADGNIISSNSIGIDIGDVRKLFKVTATLEDPAVDIGQKTQVVVTPQNLINQSINFNGITVSYESSAPDVAEVSGDGVVTGKSLGHAVIKVTAVQETVKTETEVEIFVRSKDIVVSSDFEDDAVSSVPKGFSVSPSTQYVSVSEAQANSGNKSVHMKDTLTNAMTCLRASDSVTSGERSIAFSVYPINLNTSLCIKFYPDNTFTQSQWQFNISLSSDGAVKYYDGAAWHVLLPANTVKMNAWNQVKFETNKQDKSIRATVGDLSETVTNTRSAVLRDTMGVEIHSGSSVTPGCEVYIDDVTVYGKEIAVNQAENLLKNPGFEDGTEGWFGAGAAVESVTDERYCGIKSIRIQKSSSWGYAGQKVEVEPGKTYSASAWVKLGSDGPARRVNLCGTYKDQSGKDVYVEMVKPTIEPGEWTKLSGSITIPDNVKEITLYVQSWGADGDASLLAQGFFVDNVKFAQAQ